MRAKSRAVFKEHAREDQPEGHGHDDQKGRSAFAAMLVSRAAGAPGPIETNLTRPAAALNKKKPGIIETTAEKARAAKGRCRRSTTGVRMTLIENAGHERPGCNAFSPDGDQCPACGMGEHAGDNRLDRDLRKAALAPFLKRASGGGRGGAPLSCIILSRNVLACKATTLLVRAIVNSPATRNVRLLHRAARPPAWLILISRRPILFSRTPLSGPFLQGRVNR